MSDCVRVSVVIAAHNAAEYLPRALRSALQQSETNIEILVVDDASDDGTQDIVAAIARCDDRLRYIRNPNNVGPSASRNDAIQNARGDWIAVLDADDWFSKDRIRVLLDLAERYKADIVSDGIEVFDERTGRPTGPMFCDGEIPPLISALAFVNGNLPDPVRPRAGFGFLKPLIRMKFLTETGISYAPEMRFAEDYRLYLELLLSGGRWITTSQNFYNYSVRSGSITARHNSEDLSRVCRFERVLFESKDRTIGWELRAALQAHCRTLDERYYDALFAESVARRHMKDVLSTMTLNTLAFRCCARRAIRGVARRVLPSREGAEAA